MAKEIVIKITSSTLVIGESIQYEKNENVAYLKWYVNDDEIDSLGDNGYAPSVYDYEKWIKVEAYNTDDIKIGEDQIYFSKLPVVYINTNDGEDITSRTETKEANMYIQGNDKYVSQYNGDIEIKARGNQSFYFPKKPYKIKLNKSTDMFGFGKSKHWVLIANYRDESLLRNTVANDISVKMGLVGADTTWVDVVVNGEYIGNYQFCEQIRVDENRVDIFDWSEEAENVAKAIYKEAGLTKKERDELEELLETNYSWVSTGIVTYKSIDYNIKDYYDYNTNIDGGYLFELNSYVDYLDGERENFEFSTEKQMRVIVDRPETGNTNSDMVSYINDYWNDFEKCYYSYDGYNDKNKHYSEYADFDLMIKYWLLQELVGNNDAYARSRWCYKDNNDVICFGPVWDFDFGFGSAAIGSDATGWKFSKNNNVNNLFKEWVDDPYFVIKAQEEYWNIRPYVLSIIDEGGLISDYNEYLKESGNANDALWHWKRGYEEDRKSVNVFLNERIAWLDEQFATQDSIIESLNSKASSNPYSRSTDNLSISLKNTLSDDSEYTYKSDGILSDGYNLDMIIDVNDNATSKVGVYVNGLRFDEYQVEDSKIKLTISKDKLTEEKGTNNVISLIGFDSNNNVTCTNFATVIQKDVELKTGIPYQSDGEGNLNYDNTVPHIIINQVYGGKKKESYASHSFIELYNPLDEAVDLSGWSLQYRSSIDGGDNAAWNKLDLTGTIPAKSSYLVRCKSIKDPVEGSIDIDKFDQEWDQVINNKGCSVVLVANNDLIDANSTVFDNKTEIPDIFGYVDMVGVSGNDTDDADVINNEAALFFEKEASKVQSKKTGIRRKNLTDTDDNTVDGDFEAIDYSFDNSDYRAFIAPRCSADGAWEYNEDNIPYFTVTYVNQPGGDLQEEKYKYTSKVVKPKDPTRIGYSFTGWFEDKACTKAYNFKNKPTSDITLYAGWKVNSYKVSFDTDGGSAIEDVTYTYGSQISIPAEPIKEGFTFDGWYKDSEFAEEFEFSKMPAEDITIYAKWIKNKYRISFVTNGGSAVEDIEAEFGAVVSKPTIVPEKEGYTFIGWFSDRTCETEYEFTTMPANNVKLYAGWKINQYTISFETNGGSVVDSITADFGAKIREPKDPSFEGYGFMGWFIDEALTIPYEFDTMPAENVTIYAKWAKDTYRIQFMSRGGSDVEDIIAEYGSEVKAPEEAPVKEGYTFAGWFDEMTSETPYEFTTMPAKNLRLYARWTVNKYSISFETNGGSEIEAITGDYDSKVNEPKKPVKEGFAFDGWFADEELSEPFEFDTMPASDITVYAKWKKEAFRIRFITNGGSDVDSIEAEYGDEIAAPANEPVKEGYTFTGWYSDKTCENKFEFATMPASNVDVYAGWKINQYTISFETNGGSKVDDIKADYNTEVKAPATPTKDGYAFGGWYSDKELKTVYEFSLMPSEDITVYAKWVKKNVAETEDPGQGGTSKQNNSDQGGSGTANQNNDQNQTNADSKDSKSSKTSKQINAGEGVGTISGDGKILTDTFGKKYYVKSSIKTSQLKKNLAVADKKSGGKYKITKVVKENGKVVRGNVTYMAPYDRNCTKMTAPKYVVIGGVKFKVIAIYKDAFKNCKKLKSATIECYVRTIGANAFDGCKNLKKVTIRSNRLTKIGASAFKGIDKNAKFKVTKHKVNKYKNMILKAGAPGGVKVEK
jgi:uncharacterized repeat protein (TIGR02543 family)